jgi:2-phosphosulfolactate phosphatase
MARRTLLGAALNRQAIADAVADESRIDLLCAGTDGAVTGEDVLCAGAIVQAVTGPQRPAYAATLLHFTPDEGARTALTQWRRLEEAAQDSGRTAAAQLAHQMRDTPGGRNLLKIGHDADLAACARLDSLAVVPCLDRAAGEIRPA